MNAEHRAHARITVPRSSALQLAHLILRITADVFAPELVAQWEQLH